MLIAQSIVRRFIDADLKPPDCSACKSWGGIVSSRLPALPEAALSAAGPEEAAAMPCRMSLRSSASMAISNPPKAGDWLLLSRQGCSKIPESRALEYRAQ